MSLPPSGPDQTEILALLHLYRDWGVDSYLDETPPTRLDQPPPCIASTPRQGQKYKQRASIRPDPVIRTATLRRLPIDYETANLWGVDTFPECALARTASNSVRPHLIPGARLMLIGDAPDADEDRSGKVFSGDTGRLLDLILTSIGLDRSTFSQTPALPWRPPGGRTISSIEMRECRPLLDAVITKARPERLLLLGQTPLRLLVDEQASLNRSRGAWIPLRLENGSTIAALAMQHPQQLVSSARARREMWKDLIFLAETLDQLT